MSICLFSSSIPPLDPSRLFSPLLYHAPRARPSFFTTTTIFGRRFTTPACFPFLPALHGTAEHSTYGDAGVSRSASSSVFRLHLFLSITPHPRYFFPSSTLFWLGTMGLFGFLLFYVMIGFLLFWFCMYFMFVFSFPVFLPSPSCRGGDYRCFEVASFLLLSCFTVLPFFTSTLTTISCFGKGCGRWEKI